MPVAPPIRVAGHFGEFFQGRLGPEGPVVLVTVPCAALGVEGEAEPGAFAITGLDVSTPARRFFEASGGVPKLRFRLRADAPAGAGAGMSTAALLALAKAAGVEPGHNALLTAEGAVDPLMLDAPGDVLWASREARVVQTFAALPEWKDAAIHAVVHEVAERLQLGMGKVAQPLRVAATGTAVSPPIDATLRMLGRERTLARIDRALAHIG